MRSGAEGSGVSAPRLGVETLPGSRMVPVVCRGSGFRVWV